jgi:hypothetical protein
MHEPEIICPNCRHPIKLTESLAAPLIAETQARHKAELLNKELEYSKKADDLRKQQEDLAEARASFEDQLATRLNAERVRIADAEAKKAKDFAALEMEIKTKELEELRQVLAINTQKLAEAQQAQADLLRKQRALDDATRELELTIETRVQGNLAEIRTKAQNEAQDALKLKLSEKDQQMAAMHKTIEELKRKAEQGSQQSQGEIFELELEELLRNRFPMDLIEPVAKGELGADLVQHVNAAAGQTAGVILWETKRTKAWSDGWLSKLKGDPLPMIRRVPRLKPSLSRACRASKPIACLKLPHEPNGCTKAGMSFLPIIMPPRTMNSRRGGRTRAKSAPSFLPSNGTAPRVRPPMAAPGRFR